MSAAPPVSQGFGLLGAASRSRQSYAALRSEGAPLLLPKPLPAHRVAPHTPPPRPSPAVGFVTGPSATLTIRPTPKELEKLGVPFSRGLDTTVEVRSSREGAHLGSALKESWLAAADLKPCHRVDATRIMHPLISPNPAALPIAVQVY